MARRHAGRLGIPALIVAALALVAPWRVGPPAIEPAAAGTSGTAVPPGRCGAVDDAGRSGGGQRRWPAGLTRICGGARDHEPSHVLDWSGRWRATFVVLDPDVKRAEGAAIAEGRRVTLIGLVRPAPDTATAIRQWKIDEATAKSLTERGTYLHVTEIRAS